MIDKIQSIFKSRFLYYLVFAIVCFFLYFIDLNTTAKKYIILYIVFFVFILFFVFITIKKRAKSEKDYPKLYLFLVSVLGFVVLIVSPPFTSSDEQSHLYRAYEITEGHFVTLIGKDGELASMPSSLYKMYSGSDEVQTFRNDSIKYRDIIAMVKVPLNKNELTSYGAGYASDYANTALYSPFQYLPHCIGVIIAKAFNLGPFWILMFGRLFNLLFYALLTTFGLKQLPKAKLFAMLVLLSPVMLVGASTFSADGFTYAVIFLFLSYVLRYNNSTEIIGLRDKIILLILSIFIAMCKIVYLPIVLLIFAIPNKCFTKKRDSYLFKFILLFIGFLFGILWYGIASSTLNSFSSDAIIKKQFIFTHIFNYFFIIIRTYFENFDIYLENLFFGEQLYHSQLKIYSIFSISYVIIIFLSLFTDKRKNKISSGVKSGVIFIIILILVLLATALFVQYISTTESLIISGIQGRYLIPICFLLIFLVECKKQIINEKYIFEIFMLLQIPTFMTILTRFVS